MGALLTSFVGYYRIVIGAAGRSDGDCRARCRAEDIEMVAIISGACSVVHSIAIDIWA